MKLFKENIILASGINRVISRLNETAKYTCFASNSFGTDSRNFQVTLLGKYNTGSYWTNAEPLLTRNNTHIYTNLKAEFSFRTSQLVETINFR